ncbi:hypothetical protein EDC04DRAFT_2599620 [Pisolithus marmoratus]|nr:hypothetical protein EDC04DRAFT_2599620 [Pisolithus marmoratus]
MDVTLLLEQSFIQWRDSSGERWEKVGYLWNSWDYWDASTIIRELSLGSIYMPNGEKYNAEMNEIQGSISRSEQGGRFGGGMKQLQAKYKRGEEDNGVPMSNHWVKHYQKCKETVGRCV